jgi:hypothetical protein
MVKSAQEEKLNYRLGELDKKSEEYSDRTERILDTIGYLLDKIGESASRDERISLRIQLATALEEAANLRPLTVEEVVEMEEINEELKGE